MVGRKTVVRVLPEMLHRLKDFEAQIARVIGMFGANFGGGFFYAGFGDVEDGWIACFMGFGFFVGFFWPLYADLAAVTVLFFGVKLHDGMGGCAAACEEV